MTPDILEYRIVTRHVEDSNENALPDRPIGLKKIHFETYTTALSFWEENGRPAGIRDLIEPLGLKAESGVHLRLKNLVNLGCMKHEDGGVYTPVLPRGYFFLEEEPK